MADLTYAKARPGAIWPTGGKQSGWLRGEPLIDAPRLKTFFLFGVSLVSATPDPVTGRHQVLTDEVLQMYIERAVGTLEAELGIEIMPTVVTEKHPFDAQAYNSHGYLRTKRRPVSQVIQLTVRPANDLDIYKVPTDWIEMTNSHEGQINVIPLAIANNAVVGSQLITGVGSAFLAIFATGHWVPAFWNIEYVAGFPDGMVPNIVNELVGCVAAMDVLSNLAATYARQSSASIGVDGLSQSLGSSGPELYTVRIQDLQNKRDLLTSKLKARLGLKFTVGDV